MNRLAIMETSKGDCFANFHDSRRSNSAFSSIPCSRWRAPLTAWEYAKDSDDPIFSDEETALFENSSAFWYSPLAVSMTERVLCVGLLGIFRLFPRRL